MDALSFYILGGVLILVIGYIWIRLIRDNARQEKLISKHTREIAGLKYSREHKENL